MGDMMGKVIEISESTSSCSSHSEKEDDSPLKPIFCLKSRIDMKEVEDREDCFILDFDPYEPLDLSKLSMSKDLDHSGAPDLSVIAEKGQVACRDYPHSRHVCVKYPFVQTPHESDCELVACRDYPHSRHVCVKYPFEQTPHESYCELCYCYVCDLAAPCKSWAGQTNAHCNAIDSEAWKVQRKLMRGPTPKFEN